MILRSSTQANPSTFGQILEKIMEFSRFSTSSDYTSQIPAKILKISPDSCVSDHVELVRKKNHGKILSLDKVTGFQKYVNLIFFTLKKMDKNCI